jgi:RNA polymerase sigma-70 factor (ECF subfamily)
MIDLEKTPTIRADIELIRKLQTGDFQPVGTLIDRYGRDLMHYLASILNNRERAEDVFQETWSRVLQSIRRFDLRQPFGPWLFRIARNLAYDQLRKEKRWRFWFQQTPDEKPIFEPRTESVFDRRLMNQDLAREVLTRLEPMYREILWLRFFKDNSYEEIADLCHLPLGTVKTRLRRALQRAGEVWEETVGEESHARK